MASKERKIVVDFEGVESGGGRVRIPEGDYAFEVKKVENLIGGDSEKPYLKFHFEAKKGNSKGIGKVLTHNCSLQKQALWNLRNLIESTGRQVSSKAIKLDLDKMIGWTLAGTVIDEEFEGKKYSVISAFFPIADLTVSKKKEEKEETEEAEESGETEAAAEEDDAEELFN